MDDQNQIRPRLVSLVQEVIENDRDIKDSDHLQNDLGIDSIAFISLIVEIEITFDVIMPDEMLTQDQLESFENLLTTVTDLKAKINEKE